MPSSSAATQPAAFRGRHVFVAGGSSGINFGIAQAFARAGAVISVAADVRLPAAVEAALAQAVERFGPIDVLVSGAAGNFLLARPCA